MAQSGYAYIYDDFLSDKKYERDLAVLESRLATLDLAGRVGKLALFRSAKDLVESLASQGVTTIVVVGNDRTLDKVLWFLPYLKVTLGYLPVTEPCGIAAALGIPKGEEACDILAARLIEKLDMGLLDERYFLTEVILENSAASVDIEGRFRLSPMHGGRICIRNLGGIGEADKADAGDGLLEAVITPQTESAGFFKRNSFPETRIKFEHGGLTAHDPMEARVDCHTANSLKFKLGIEKGKLSVITGRRRKPAQAGLPKRSEFANLPGTVRNGKNIGAGGGIGIRTSLRG